MPRSYWASMLMMCVISESLCGEMSIGLVVSAEAGQEAFNNNLMRARAGHKLELLANKYTVQMHGRNKIPPIVRCILYVATVPLLGI